MGRRILWVSSFHWNVGNIIHFRSCVDRDSTSVLLAMILNRIYYSVTVNITSKKNPSPLLSTIYCPKCISNKIPAQFDVFIKDSNLHPPWDNSNSGTLLLSFGVSVKYWEPYQSNRRLMLEVQQLPLESWIQYEADINTPETQFYHVQQARLKFI